MAEVRDKNVDTLIGFLKEKPRSINEIAKGLEINWRTAESYITLLKSLDLIFETNNKYFYKDKNNYFWLPVKSEHEKHIKTIYAHIKKFANKEPTKTQVYKIIWKINKLLDLKLPIGWYKYGPCCEIVYQGNEEILINLQKQELNLIKETTEKYVALDNFDLQRKIYSEEDNKLYLLKEQLLNCDTAKEKLDELLMQLIKLVPKEAIDVTTDFTRLVLLKGWDKDIKECWLFLWKYITIINHKESLSFYYDDISAYMGSKIEEAKKDAQTMILSLTQSYMESKHSQDSRYQSWKKKH
ncbi:MAG: hypothetical protein ACP5OA_03110 [Candidatus Woesearchaeota archaeon]